MLFHEQTPNQRPKQVARIGKAVPVPRLERWKSWRRARKPSTPWRSRPASHQVGERASESAEGSPLVETRREGRFIAYRLSGEDVSALWVNLRTVAEEHLVELKVAMDQIFAAPEKLDAETRRSLMEKARRGEVVVIDVRPSAEYASGHLPFARSMPLDEIRQRIKELPADRDIVAYCRGPFCMMSAEAVALLQEHGYRAQKIADGTAEWQAAGLPLA
jgi:rhodanese-related sulfurtransferase